ncbi:hypothetical protein [Ferruginibacter profundus]
MKSRKLFELNYVFNCALLLTFAGYGIFVNLNSNYNADEFLFIYVFPGLFFILIVAAFSFACYTLNKVVKTGLQFLKRAGISGTVCCIFFNILSFFLIIEAIDLVNNYFKYRFSTTSREIFFICYIFSLWSLQFI